MTTRNDAMKAAIKKTCISSHVMRGHHPRGILISLRDVLCDFVSDDVASELAEYIKYAFVVADDSPATIQREIASRVNRLWVNRDTFSGSVIKSDWEEYSYRRPRKREQEFRTILDDWYALRRSRKSSAGYISAGRHSFRLNDWAYPSYMNRGIRVQPGRTSRGQPDEHRGQWKMEVKEKIDSALFTVCKSCLRVPSETRVDVTVVPNTERMSIAPKIHKTWSGGRLSSLDLSFRIGYRWMNKIYKSGLWKAFDERYPRSGFLVSAEFAGYKSDDGYDMNVYTAGWFVVQRDNNYHPVWKEGYIVRDRDNPDHYGVAKTISAATTSLINFKSRLLMEKFK